MDKGRIGVVGTGYLGRLHARVLTEMPEVEVVGFVQPRDAVAAEVESNLKLRRFATVTSSRSTWSARSSRRRPTGTTRSRRVWSRPAAT